MQQLTSMSKRPVAIKKVVMYSDGSAEMAIKNLATGNVTHKYRGPAWSNPSLFSGVLPGEPAELVPEDVVPPAAETAHYGGEFERELFNHSIAFADAEAAEQHEIEEVLHSLGFARDVDMHAIHDFNIGQLAVVRNVHREAAALFNDAGAEATRAVHEGLDSPQAVQFGQHARQLFKQARLKALDAHQIRFNIASDLNEAHENLPIPYDLRTEPLPRFFTRNFRLAPHGTADVNQIPWLTWIHHHNEARGAATSRIPV
jgi:hypothetical protein